MMIDLLPVVAQAGALFERAGFPLYAVGGQVRNALLGYPISDLDICGTAMPEQAAAIFEDAGYGVIPKALQFGTIQVNAELDGERFVMEYTTFREDVYFEDGSHRPAGVTFSSNIERDALRRDFSVNALYARAVTGEMIDPLGGLKDLDQRRLRTTNPDPNLILRDDALRMLRLVRFACELDFDIDPATEQAAKTHAGLLRDIPVERIWQELQKILLSDVRYAAAPAGGRIAHQHGLFLLVDYGLMGYIFPELLEGADVPQRSEFHRYNVLEHNIRACGASEAVLPVRLAALLHDVGKPEVWRETGKMLLHDQRGADMSKVMLERLRAPKALVERVYLLVKKHMLDLNNMAKENTLRKHFVQMGAQAGLQLASVREADFLASGMQSAPVASAERWRSIIRRMMEEKVPFDINQLNIGGDAIARILNEPRGPRIGEVKRALWLHCAQYPCDNNEKRLRQLAKQYRMSKASNASVLPNIKK